VANQSRTTDLESYQTIDNQPDFDALTDHLRTLDRIGFDVEFVAEDGYTAKLCLLQIATEDGVWIVDPLTDIDTLSFWHIVSDDKVQKIVHAGLEDLAIGFHTTNETPKSVFDVQIAAGLVGYDYPMSLQRLAKALTGARLHKSQTLTDWRKRPLSDAQMRYAAEDVAYLLPMHDRIHRELHERGRIEWAEEDFGRFGDAKTYKTEKKELFRKVKGAGSLTSKELAILRELAAERDKIAERLNRPARAVLKDHLMLAVAKQGIVQRDDLKALRGLSLNGESSSRIIAAVQRGLATPADQRPKRHEPEDDSVYETTLRKLVSAVVTNFCHTEGIALQMMASNKDIRALVLSHTRNHNRLPPGQLQKGWRKRKIGEMLDDVLRGQRSVRVRDDENGPRLVIE
jgi:ribonuclease D